MGSRRWRVHVAPAALLLVQLATTAPAHAVSPPMEDKDECAGNTACPPPQTCEDTDHQVDDDWYCACPSRQHGYRIGGPATCLDMYSPVGFDECETCGRLSNRMPGSRPTKSTGRRRIAGLTINECETQCLLDPDCVMYVFLEVPSKTYKNCHPGETCCATKTNVGDPTDEMGYIIGTMLAVGCHKDPAADPATPGQCPAADQNCIDPTVNTPTVGDWMCQCRSNPARTSTLKPYQDCPTPAPPTPNPPTPAPPTPVPPTPAPPTPVPPTPAPPTPVPPTPAPPTPVPPTPAPPTPVPPTPAPPTPVPPTPAPPTPVPPTPAPPTPVPPTPAPPIPSTSAPLSPTPPTPDPATSAPSSPTPSTPPLPNRLPPTATRLPVTQAPATSTPPTPHTPTGAPATDMPTSSEGELVGDPTRMPAVEATPAPLETKEFHKARENVMVVSAAAAATAAVAVAGASATPALRLVAVSSSCGLGDGAVDGRYSFAMTPLQLQLAGSQALGAMVGNALLAVMLIGLSWLISVAIGCVAPYTCPGSSLLRNPAALLFPSAPLVVFIVLYQGTTLASLDLVLNAGDSGLTAAGILGTLVCVAVPFAVCYRVRHMVPYDVYVRYDDEILGRAMVFLLDRGEWVSTSPDRHYAVRWAPVLRAYQQKRCWYAGVEFGASLLVSMAQAVNPKDMAGCGHVKLASGLIFVVLLVLEVSTWPHLQQRNCMFDVMILGGQSAAMVSLALSYYSGEPEAAGFGVAAKMLEYCIWVIVVRTALDVGAVVANFVTGRRERLQREAFVEGPTVPSPHLSSVWQDGDDVLKLPPGIGNGSAAGSPLLAKVPPSTSTPVTHPAQPSFAPSFALGLSMGECMGLASRQETGGGGASCRTPLLPMLPPLLPGADGASASRVTLPAVFSEEDMEGGECAALGKGAGTTQSTANSRSNSHLPDGNDDSMPLLGVIGGVGSGRGAEYSPTSNHVLSFPRQGTTSKDDLAVFTATPKGGARAATQLLATALRRSPHTSPKGGGGGTALGGSAAGGAQGSAGILRPPSLTCNAGRYELLTMPSVGSPRARPRRHLSTTGTLARWPSVTGSAGGGGEVSPTTAGHPLVLRSDAIALPRSPRTTPRDGSSGPPTPRRVRSRNASFLLM